jgi:YDG/SRA domain.
LGGLLDSPSERRDNGAGRNASARLNLEHYAEYDRMPGRIPGVTVGASFEDREALRKVGVHLQKQLGLPAWAFQVLSRSF